MPPDLTAHWLGKLANLNAAKTAGLGVAPHKPLMIFSVMDLIEMDILRDRWVPYNADLVTRFRDYWDLVVDRRKNRPEITMPFNALGGERDAIWSVFSCALPPNHY
jgi:putative restriction endonuclease